MPRVHLLPQISPSVNPKPFIHSNEPYRTPSVRLFSPKKNSTTSEIPLPSPRMMNLLALTLLLSSLAAGGLFSPPLDRTHDIIREGHRVIVVEYESQLPSSDSVTSGAGKLAQQARDAYVEAASVLPNVGQGLSRPPIEKLTDADGGACEEKASFVNNIKNKAAQLEKSVAGTLKIAAETTKKKAAQLQDSIADAAGKAAQTTTQKATHLHESATDAVKDASEITKQKAAHLKESAANTIKSASKITKEKAVQLQESTADAVKSTAEVAVDAGKDVAGNISASASKTAHLTTEAARHNLTDILRRARELGRDAVALVVAGAAVRSAAAVAHLLGFSVAYGACVWVTFASSHLLASVLPRQQFGIVQSRLYPTYFRLLALGIVAALTGHFLGHGRRSVAERMQGYNLMATLAAALVNLVWLEPIATKAMFERMKLEKEEGRGRDVTDVGRESALPGVEATAMAAVPIADAVAAREVTVKDQMSEASKRLKRLNNISSFLNALVLMGLSWHLVHLAQRLASVTDRCE